MYNLIVADSMDDYLDFVEVYKLDLDECIYISRNTKFEKLLGFKTNNFTITATRHACKLARKKILFMDLQLFLLKANKNITTTFENDN